MTKPNFRPIAPLDVDDDALQSVNDRLGVPTMVRPDDGKSQRRDGATARRPAVAASPQQKLTIRVPKTLVSTLKRDALDQDSTVRQIVLGALRKAGYQIADADMADGAGGNV